MTRHVGIPGCGRPQNEKIKHSHKPSHYSLQSINMPENNETFSYNLNKYRIPHGTTNIYSSLPVLSNSSQSQNSEEYNHFIPGGFKVGTNETTPEEEVPRQSEEIVDSSTSGKIGSTPQFIPISLNMGQNSKSEGNRDIDDGLITGGTDLQEIKTSKYNYDLVNCSGFNKENYTFCSKDYNKYKKNNNKSINSAKNNINANKKQKIDQTHLIVTPIGGGTQSSYTTPSETEFHNKKFPLSSTKKQKKQVGAIPIITHEWVNNEQSYSTLNSKVTGNAWYTSPHEMGFDNKQMSVSSQREISSNLKNTVNDISKPFDTSITKPGSKQNTRTIVKHLSNVSQSNSGRGMSIVAPWEIGFNNKSISTSSAREISQKTNIATTNISKPFSPIKTQPRDVFYDASSSMSSSQEVTPENKQSLNKNVISSNTGAGFSLSAPWEMGFNNNRISTSSAREITPRTNITVCDIVPRANDLPIKSISGIAPLITPRNKTSTPSNQNVFSSGTGAGTSISSPWEMGFNNTQMSTSSAREISTHSNITIYDISQRSKGHRELTPGDLGIISHKKENYLYMPQTIISSGTGSQFSLKSPWEMGFNNQTISSSSAREISTKVNKSVADIPRNFVSNSSHKLKSAEKPIHMPLSTIFNELTKSGCGSGMSLTSPSEMGFDNKHISSSSIREISTSTNKSVRDIPQAFNSENEKLAHLESKSVNKAPLSKEATIPISSRTNFGSSNAFLAPHELGVANKKLSTSSTREISSKTNRMVQSTVITPSGNTKQRNSDIPVSAKNNSSFQTRNMVGYDIACQGLSISQLPPPAGIKGLVKSFRELYDLSTKNNRKIDHSLELQEPLESAFTPIATKKRELKDRIHNVSLESPTNISGKYNLLSQELANPIMSSYIFSLGSQTNRNIGKGEQDISPLETDYKRDLDRGSRSEQNFKSKGEIVALDSLKVGTVDSSVSNEQTLFDSIEKNKPTKNGLIALDSMTEKHHTTTNFQNEDNKNDTNLIKFSSKKDVHDDTNPKQNLDYWSQSHKQNHAKILKGSRRPATDDQLRGKSDIYVELSDPKLRRRSLGSVTNSQEIMNYPSLIDPSVPTYGFTKNENDKDILASNEYYVSNPLSEDSIRKSSITSKSFPPSLVEEERGDFIQIHDAEDLSLEEPNDATIRSLKESTPRSYDEAWNDRGEYVIHKQPVRRKSRASIVLGRFAKAVTKSTI